MPTPEPTYTITVRPEFPPGLLRLWRWDIHITINGLRRRSMSGRALTERGANLKADRRLSFFLEYMEGTAQADRIATARQWPR